MESQSVVLTCDEVAGLLKISRPQVYLGIKQNSIPHIKIGRRILVPVASLNKLLLECAGDKV